MRQPNIDRRALQHKIRGTPKTILGPNEKMHDIEHVYVQMGLTKMFNPVGYQQTTAGNGCLGYDYKYSTPLPEGKTFAVGDTVEFLTAPICDYPRKMVISSITPAYDAMGSSDDNKTLHHLGINLR